MVESEDRVVTVVFAVAVAGFAVGFIVTADKVEEGDDEGHAEGLMKRTRAMS